MHIGQTTCILKYTKNSFETMLYLDVKLSYPFMIEYNLHVVKWEHIPNSRRIGERKLNLFEK